MRLPIVDGFIKMQRFVVDNTLNCLRYPPNYCWAVANMTDNDSCFVAFMIKSNLSLNSIQNSVIIC